MSFIVALAPVYGIDPKVALAVAKVESSYNPKAIGAAGEIGVMQLMPSVYKEMGFTRKQMLDPHLNILAGLEVLQKTKKACVFKRDINWLVCYNVGIHGAKRIHHPSKFKYVLLIKKAMASGGKHHVRTS